MIDSGREHLRKRGKRTLSMQRTRLKSEHWGLALRRRGRHTVSLHSHVRHRSSGRLCNMYQVRAPRCPRHASATTRRCEREALVVPTPAQALQAPRRALDALLRSRCQGARWSYSSAWYDFGETRTGCMVRTAAKHAPAMVKAIQRGDSPTEPSWRGTGLVSKAIGRPASNDTGNDGWHLRGSAKGSWQREVVPDALQTV